MSDDKTTLIHSSGAIPNEAVDYETIFQSNRKTEFAQETIIGEVRWAQLAR